MQMLETKTKTLSNVIYNAIRLDYESSQQRDYIGISEIAYCQRKLYLQKSRNEKQEINPENLLKIYEGTSAHELLQSLLWKYRGRLDGFKYYKAEKEVEIEGILKGHIDLLCELDGQIYVTDFKIVGNRKFSMLKDTPDEHYRIQLMLYAYSLKLPTAILLYINKETGKSKEYLIEVELETVAKYIEKAKELRYCIMEQVEPEIPFGKETESWECSYCRYKQECWNKSFIEIEKKDEAELIDAELENRYIKLCDEIEELEEEKKIIKDTITASLNGKKGFGFSLTATYTPPSEIINYDKNRLELLVSSDILSRCAKRSQKAGYYTLKQRSS